MGEIMEYTRRHVQRYVYAVLVSVLFFGLFAFCNSRVENKFPQDHGKTGGVVTVYDGDTIKIRFEDGHERKVRLIGIDCPEIGDPNKKKSLQALLAKRFAFHCLFRKTVELTYESEREDKYGRLLAYVWIEGKLFNEFILNQGFAEVFWAFPYKLKERFIQVQNAAREHGRGFWREKPYPLIPAKNAREHIGKLIRVGFTCVQTGHQGRFFFLYAKKKSFSALIPEEYRPNFPDLKAYKGKRIVVFGFLEEYRGQPQIMVFVPSQIERIQ